MKKFTYASAFSGIGGMTLGLKPLGGEGVLAWEYDPTEKRTQYAQEAHRLLHPEIPVHGDICEADTANMPDFDLLCFTPPCQAFSVAGKRGGFEDTRGTLTFEALRIARDKRPKALFMENVKGLVNHDKGDTMSTIIHAINEIGYTVDFTILNSKYFDVAQNRERVYLIGIRDDLITPEQWNNLKGTTMLPKAKRRYQEEGAKTFNFDWPEQTEVRTRLRDFLEDNVDEKYYLSEDKTAALVAQLEAKYEVIDGMIRGGTQKRAYEGDGTISPTLTAAMGLGGGHTPLTVEGLPIKEATKQGYAVGVAVNIQFPNSKTRRGRVGKQMANTIEASGINQGVVEKSTLEFFIENSFRQEANGNGFRFSPHVEQNAMVAKTITTRGGGRMDDNFIISGLETDKSQFTFDSKNEQAAEVMANLPRYRIRKLTPTECLRLQSVPNWAIDVILTHFSDSRAYKFAGNGLTTNVITAIGERLLPYLDVTDAIQDEEKGEA